MRYMLLIHSDPSSFESLTEEEVGALMGAYGAFTEKYADRTSSSERLQPTSTATTVRVRNGDVVTTDGPFMESKEELGGYYIVEAENLDEAIAIAGEIPSAQAGAIEVRPVWEMEE